MFTHPFIVAEGVAVAALSLCVLFVAMDDHIRIVIKNNWVFLSTLLLIAVAYRYPSNSHWFHGLEYEDSYVYAVAARDDSRYLNQSNPKTDPKTAFLVRTCAVGSASQCEVISTFSGHYIGWPAIMRLAIRLFGYSDNLPNLLNVGGACVGLVFIFVTAKEITGRSVDAAAASIIFASTPVFAVHGMASYAEPASNVVLAMELVPVLALVYRPMGTVLKNVVCLSSISVALVLSVLIKRENLILIVIFASVAIVLAFRDRAADDSLKRQRVLLACCCAFVFVVAVMTLRIDVSLKSEAAEFGAFPFSAKNTLTMLPGMISAFMSPKWYAASDVFFVIGSVAAVVRFGGKGVSVVAVVAAFLGIYAAHLHGYYQLHGQRVVPYDMLRFAVNFASAWSVLAGIGAGVVLQTFSAHNWRRMAIAVLILYFGCTYVATRRLRENSFETEYWTRVNPAKTALGYAASDLSHTYIVSLEPLTIQTLGSPNAKVFAEYALTPETLQRLATDDPDLRLLYIQQNQYQDTMDIARYKVALRCLDAFDRFDLDNEDEFSLLLLTPLSNGSYSCQVPL